MRIWDIPVSYLCMPHLMAQHMEAHTMYNVIYLEKKGYSKHPETLRWVNKLDQLKLVHNLTAQAMLERGYNHHSPIEDEIPVATLRDNYGVVNPIWHQIHSIYRKGCACDLDSMYQWYDSVREWPSEQDNDVF